MNLKSLLVFTAGAFLGGLVVFGLGPGAPEPEKVICISTNQLNNPVADQIVDVHHRLNLNAR